MGMPSPTSGPAAQAHETRHPPREIMLALWVGTSLPVTQMTKPKVHFPTKKRTVKNPVQLICVHILRVFKRR